MRSCAGPLGRSVAAVIAALALAVTPPAVAGVPNAPVAVSITNSGPDVLRLADAHLTGGGCWSRPGGKCAGGPPRRIAPGSRATAFVRGRAAVRGEVAYSVRDRASGFRGSGVRIAFRHAPSGNTADCDAVLYYSCKGLDFPARGRLRVATPVVAADSCPGSGGGACPYTSDEIWGSAGSGNGQFDQPTGLALGLDSLVYVTDVGNHRVQLFAPDGEFVTAFGSQGSGPGQLQQPNDVAVQELGGGITGVYVADPVNRALEIYDQTGTFIARMPLGAQVREPSGAASDSGGNLYASDFADNRVMSMTSMGSPIGIWGSQGSGQGQFQGPRGIAVDSQGSVSVVDAGNDRVQQFKQDGTFVDAFGSPGSGLGQFSGPWGIAVFSPGALAVTDTGNDRVELFSGPQNPIVAWGQQGTDPGEFQGPRGIAIDSVQNLYVADTGNNRIQRFEYAETQVTFASPRASASARRHPTMRLRARRGRAFVRLSCRNPGARRCRGVLTFHNRGGVLARRAFAIRAGRRTTVKLGLKPAARRRLARGRAVSGRLLAHTRQADGGARITHERRLVVRRAG